MIRKLNGSAPAETCAYSPAEGGTSTKYVLVISRQTSETISRDADENTRAGDLTSTDCHSYFEFSLGRTLESLVTFHTPGPPSVLIALSVG